MRRAGRLSVKDALLAGGSGQVVRPPRTGLWMAGIEMAAALVLTAGALMMLQSFASLTRTDLAFRDDHLLTVRLEPPADRYPSPAARARFGATTLDALRALPGVDHATIWGPSMFARSTWISFVASEERASSGDSERLMVWRHSTNPGALADLGIRLISGREFLPTDTLETPWVVIVSEATARRLWPGQEAVGRRLRSGAGATATTNTVIGVAADARHRGRFRFSQGAAADEPQLDVYLPYAQRPNALVTLGVRTAGDPASFADLRSAR